MIDKPAPAISEKNREYFEGTRVGELRIRCCRKCSTRFRFAHEWCPNCWSPELTWVKATGNARVSHYSVVHQAPTAAFAAGGPYVLALVELEEGVRMMTNIVDCDVETVHVGMAVTLTFEDRGEERLPVFVPR
jgi:uncharacterized OB-fold protein